MAQLLHWTAFSIHEEKLSNTLNKLRPANHWLEVPEQIKTRECFLIIFNKVVY